MYINETTRLSEGGRREVKMTQRRFYYGLLLALIITAGVGVAAGADELYYAIEQDGVICGYAHVIISQTEIDGQPATQLIDSLWMHVSAMGKSLEGKYRFEYHIDPTTGRYFYHRSDIDQGSLKLSAQMRIENDTVHIVSQPGDDTSAVALPGGTILQNTRLHKPLLDDFLKDTISEKEYQVFSEMDAAVNTITYTRVGTDKLELAGRTYEALELKTLNRTTGIHGQMWLDSKTGLLLKASVAVRDIYLTDAGVIKKVKVADLDDKIFARVNKVISNPYAISYMKVKARLQPGGLWVTPESLNVPGQKFDGTVEENQIDGIFEVSHARYDGSGAPAFPCNFAGDDRLRPYLQASDMIESDDPSLIEKAAQITSGAADAWQAAVRLSRWVNSEIDYDLPGGGTALNTFKTRLGECGSHSNLLAAFCRAVGIPCRTVFGCTYVPGYGGAFGQHVWNEIYMGDAGWIPVDATVEEIDYADCSHIRLGEWKSKAVMFNPQEMEILDYRTTDGSPADADDQSSMALYQPYIGEYQGKGQVLKVLVQNGSLAVDIPGKMIFELKDPDQNGEWFFKLTAMASVSFEKDSSGNIARMTIDSRQRLPRRTESTTAASDSTTPNEYRQYLGTYTIPMQNKSLQIICRDNKLALDIPGDQTIELQVDEKDGRWTGGHTSHGKLAITFDVDDAGNVQGMILSQVAFFPKIVPRPGN